MTKTEIQLEAARRELAAVRARNRDRREMDRVMGLSLPPRPTCTQALAALRKSAKPAAAQSPARTKHEQPTRLSADAAALDRAMGFKSNKPRARREGNTLTFSAAD